MHTINLACARSCELLEEYDAESMQLPQERMCELTMLIHDERNALERVLLHFSHFEKETLKHDNQLYQIKLRYYHDDETELLIRVFSFGPVLEVVSPTAFIDLIRERLNKQSFYTHAALQNVHSIHF